MYKPYLLTICICTYNRAERLKKVLRCLNLQKKVNWQRVEILVVDNNSADATSEVVSSIVGLPIRSVREIKQGLSHARNTAVIEAKGDWIIFTDDDVVLDPCWLSEFIGGIERFGDAAVLGGRILPDWGRQGPPSWFRGERLENLSGLLVWYDLGRENRLMAPTDPEPFGASFGFRRNIAEKVGQFDASLGVSGEQIGRGEETDFLRRARRMGFKCAYVGTALCYHPVDRGRLTLKGLYRYGLAAGGAHYALTGGKATGTHLRAALFALQGLNQLLKGRGDRFRQCVINIGIQSALARRTAQRPLGMRT